VSCTECTIYVCVLGTGRRHAYVQRVAVLQGARGPHEARRADQRVLTGPISPKAGPIEEREGGEREGDDRAEARQPSEQEADGQQPRCLRANC
jgi:hypothetical protein